MSDSSDPSDLEYWTIRASTSGYDETYYDDRRDFLAWLATEKAKWQAEAWDEGWEARHNYDERAGRPPVHRAEGEHEMTIRDEAERRYPATRSAYRPRQNAFIAGAEFVKAGIAGELAALLTHMDEAYGDCGRCGTGCSGCTTARWADVIRNLAERWEPES